MSASGSGTCRRRESTRTKVASARPPAATGRCYVGAVSQPPVSVVVVAYRAREFVLACLRSLEAHAGVEYQAIVVDDASGDGTPEAVRAAFPAVEVVAKPRNEGLPAGRNAALPLV